MRGLAAVELNRDGCGTKTADPEDIGSADEDLEELDMSLTRHWFAGTGFIGERRIPPDNGNQSR